MSKTVAVIGLGYVGLPVAVAFARRQPVIAFDKNVRRVAELCRGNDRTQQISAQQLQHPNLLITDDVAQLHKAQIYIVAVPTPIDVDKRPDIHLLLLASEMVGKQLKRGDIVIYESTVYPGLTEEECVPVLEQHSGLRFNQDFSVGYSPERINPNDEQHCFETITKVVSASNPQALDEVAELYESVVEAGVYRASSIKVAEAAKVIENTQRDINIAFMNELAILFERLGIDTGEVLAAAATKWNFLNFTPGLVGGHCIGVDPFYLTHKAQQCHYQPRVILAGRRINDDMGRFIAERVIKGLILRDLKVKGARIGILGFTFKENCNDIRNTRVIDIVETLLSYGVQVFVHDPLADCDEAKQEYGLSLSQWDELSALDAVILAVPHRDYLTKSVDDFKEIMSPTNFLFDVKSCLDKTAMQQAGITLWRL